MKVRYTILHIPGPPLGTSQDMLANLTVEETVKGTKPTLPSRSHQLWHNNSRSPPRQPDQHARSGSRKPDAPANLSRVLFGVASPHFWQPNARPHQFFDLVTSVAYGEIWSVAHPTTPFFHHLTLSVRRNGRRVTSCAARLGVSVRGRPNFGFAGLLCGLS